MKMSWEIILKVKTGQTKQQQQKPRQTSCWEVNIYWESNHFVGWCPIDIYFSMKKKWVWEMKARHSYGFGQCVGSREDPGSWRFRALWENSKRLRSGKDGLTTATVGRGWGWALAIMIALELGLQLGLGWKQSGETSQLWRKGMR